MLAMVVGDATIGVNVRAGFTHWGRVECARVVLRGVIGETGHDGSSLTTMETADVRQRLVLLGTRKR